MVIEARLSALLKEDDEDDDVADEPTVVATTYPPSGGADPAAGAPAGSDRIMSLVRHGRTNSGPLL